MTTSATPVAPTFPQTLEEAYRLARVDVAAKPSPELHLRWVFWHAKAMGQLEVARAALKRVELRDWECLQRAATFLPETTQHRTFMDARPVADLQRAEATVNDRAALAEALRQVAQMLGGRR